MKAYVVGTHLRQVDAIHMGTHQGSGNSEIWIGPADDDDIINEPISKKKKKI